MIDRFLVVLVLSCCLRPALAGQTDAIRVESEVIATGRAAVARYEDQELAALGFLDVTKAPYKSDSTGKVDATAAIQHAIHDVALPQGSVILLAEVSNIDDVASRNEARQRSDSICISKENSMRRQMCRREFVRTSIAAGAAIGFPAIIPASALGKDGAVPANERVALGAIACGSRSGVTKVYETYGKSEVVAVCDPIRARRQAKLKVHPNAKDYSDFRDVLARSDIDAVHIATGDYWHVPISLAAARAGKDMYTEKPLGLCIEEDLAAREIVEKHKRVFQYGTQNRSMAQLRMGLELVLNGHIGAVKELYVWAPKGMSGGSATPVLPVPEGFDYDMWLGPAPRAPFCKDRCLVQGPPNGVYHIYDYAIGFIAGWGAHPMDQLQWWADQEKLGIPVEYKGTGTIPTEGLFNTITHWDVQCTYANGLKMRFLDNDTRQAVTDIPHNKEITFGHGTLFIGTDGWVAVTRGGWKVSPKKLYYTAKNPGDRRLIVSTNHQQHFVDCVLDRKQPISDLASAVESDLVCHLSDISIRTGRAIRWDPRNETIVGDAEAAKMMHREIRKPWTL